MNTEKITKEIVEGLKEAPEKISEYIKSACSGAAGCQTDADQGLSYVVWEVDAASQVRNIIYRGPVKPAVLGVPATGRRVELPVASEWFDPGEKLPANSESVLALVGQGDKYFVAQVEFYGNEFMHEFRLGDNAIHAVRWLPIEVVQLE